MYKTTKLKIKYESYSCITVEASSPTTVEAATSPTTAEATVSQPQQQHSHPPSTKTLIFQVGTID